MAQCLNLLQSVFCQLCWSTMVQSFAAAMFLFLTVIHTQWSNLHDLPFLLTLLIQNGLMYCWFCSFCTVRNCCCYLLVCWYVFPWLYALSFCLDFKLVSCVLEVFVSLKVWSSDGLYVLTCELVPCVSSHTRSKEHFKWSKSIILLEDLYRWIAHIQLQRQPMKQIII